ncbi:MAG TPA: hypothetical protein VJ461_05870 [Candidatus Nanoarchaeia archaeon]|nr:hypothetical protein [Candidatus Nanoarchaeia archaeon]
MLQDKKQGEIELGVAYFNREEVCNSFWSRMMNSSGKIEKDVKVS